MRYRMSLVLGMVLLCSTFACNAEQPLRDPTDADRAAWRAIGNIAVTPDGKWVIYSELPSAGVGDVTVVVRSTRGTTERRYPAGPVGLGGGTAKVSHSGRWIAFELGGESALQLVDLSSGASRRFAGVVNFRWSAGRTDWLAMSSDPSDDGTASPAGGERSTKVPLLPTEFDLKLVSPTRNQVEVIKRVSEYAFDGAGARIAWSTGQGLRVRELISGRESLVDSTDTPHSYVNLTWAPSGQSLAVLRQSLSTQYPTDEPGYSLIVVRHVQTSTEERKNFDGPTWQGFPANYSICAQPVRSYWSDKRQGLVRVPLMWRANDDGVYFNVCPHPTPAPDLGLAPNVSVWNWKDWNYPARRKWLAEARAESYLSFVSLNSGRFVQLADSNLPDVTPHATGRYVLGFDWMAYGWPNDGTKSRAAQLRDYSIVDLADGSRISLIKSLPVPLPGTYGFSVAPQFSPDGAFVLYQSGGDYFSYEVATGQRRNLTTSLPTKFYFPENDSRQAMLRRPRERIPPLQGWTSDGHTVLLSDEFDVWAIPLNGGSARNLTVNGRRDGISYDRTLYAGADKADGPAEASVDWRQPLYFAASEIDAQRMGLLLVSPRGAPKMLRWDNAQEKYFQDGAAKVRLYVRQTFDEPRNIFAADSRWTTSHRLTDINPQHREIRGFPRPHLLTYSTTHGDRLHATLLLPTGYVEGHSYPTVVRIYDEYKSLECGWPDYLDRVDNSAAGYYEASSFWLERGYAVLCADIQPREGDEGAAALEGVTAAVSAAAATGIIDETRLALTGHSFGAYETNFVISQTNLFKAAVAYAGSSDLWSACGAAYENGYPYSQECEGGQVSMGGPWWEHWDAILRNSPLYHVANIQTPLLLVHGDQDGAAPYAQSIELFNALRRMGDRPVVLLQYAGEDHTMGLDSERDALERMRGLFDHYLKGEPAPRWWSDGVSYYRGEASAPQGREKQWR
jgi:dienelactone hydrolase